MILAVLQARLTSTRLPGKVLAPVLGEPMLVRQIERISRSTLIDQLVVATSVDSSDDALAEALTARGILVRRGPLDDVLARFAGVVEEFAPDTVVRLTGDNPLVDPAVIDRVIAGHVSGGADYTSNSRQRSFPYGLDVECVTTAAFERLAAMTLTPYEREHVTIGLYTRPEEFSVRQVVYEKDVSRLRWTVDYPEDFEFITTVYEHLYPMTPAFTMEDVLALLDEHPEFVRTLDEVGP